MKSFVQKFSKKAMTLVELVIASAISAIIILIVFSFVVDTMENITVSNIRTEGIDSWFSFKNTFNQFFRWGYIEPYIIDTWNNSIIILQDEYNSRWVVFGIVDWKTLKFEKNYVYWNKHVWYRLLSKTEVDNIINNNDLVYDLEVFQDKVFYGMRIKDFRVDIYNSWNIIDILISIINSRDELNFWKSFNEFKIDKSLITEFNLIF